jgi:16S rRNA (uracil1498-N3)-methyltransferase
LSTDLSETLLRTDRRYETRLYVDAPLFVGADIYLMDETIHYLRNVLRKSVGDRVRLFNGRDGEWLAGIEGTNQKQFRLMCHEQTRIQVATSQLSLFFGIIKREHLDFLVQKSCELGVSRLYPIITQRCNVRQLSLPRLQSIAREAAEQSERLDTPEIFPAQPLENIIAKATQQHTLYVCAEDGSGQPPHFAFREPSITKPTAILIGPEGGFAPDELQMIKNTQAVTLLNLGQRILRADTAALAALSCWQALRGDWARMTT